MEMNINEKTFNRLLERKAKKNNISLRDVKGDLCRRLDVSRQAIHLWCNGESKPNTEKLIFLRDYFGLNKVEDLLK